MIEISLDRKATADDDANCSPWFPANVIPFKTGVYECQFEDGWVYYNKFKGEWFCGGAYLTERRAGYPPLSSHLGRGMDKIFTLVRWRGLAGPAVLV
jgi:hypothetical protein